MPNKQISLIIRELDESAIGSDPFLLYLHGVALLHQRNMKEAMAKLIQSVTIFPYNWSAWQSLLQCVETLDQFRSLAEKLPRHLMTRIFTIFSLQEFYQAEKAQLDEIDDMLSFLPTFDFLIIQKALVLYHGLNYNESESLFEGVLARDPHRLNDMDTYSNILYVMERRAKLAYLAQMATETDKYRAETCCIVGNYYSLKSEHEKSIMYYQRALTLNRNCLSAWTLMGHEFVELKNTHAAIESYRHAIEMTQRDFRAWYGLGQAYEVLDMNYYSLYYYQRAAALKPFDSRMWQALGTCYEKLGKVEECLKCYKRGVRLGDMDPVLLLRIANVYDRLGDSDQCAKYMRECLRQAEEDDTDGDDDGSLVARLWLAKYEMKIGNYERAHKYAAGITRGNVSEMEEARSIIRETRTRLLAGGNSAGISTG